MLRKLSSKQLSKFACVLALSCCSVDAGAIYSGNILDKSKPSGGVVFSRSQPPKSENPAADLRQLLLAESAYAEALRPNEKRGGTSERPTQISSTEDSKQKLASARSVVGDYLGAVKLLEHNLWKLDTAQSLPNLGSYSAATLEDFEPREAIASIVAMARNRRIVILNEAHHVSRHRAFALKLAVALREIGFSYLACETFSDYTEDTRLRGYPTTDTGSYTREPLFADFVRRSLSLGYTPIAYESHKTQKWEDDPGDEINEREQHQAENLMRKIFANDPSAKVFIYVGYSHLRKMPNTTSISTRKELKWMAARLKSLSGLDPLTIDQTSLTDPLQGSDAAEYLKSAIALNPAVTHKSFVLGSRNKRHEFRVAGQYAGDVDIQVLHPPTVMVRGRPDWLSMDGYRRELSIPEDLWPKSGRRLIQAFLANERAKSGSRAIPLDQIVVSPKDKGLLTLMVPDGKIALKYSDSDASN
jgi:hypothetical protein